MACTGGCTLDLLLQTATSQTLSVGQTFVDNSITSFTSAVGQNQFCADCAEDITIQFKKSSDSTWIDMTPSGALKTSDNNPQNITSSDCETSDFEASWTVTVDATAAGFTWDVRLIKSTDVNCNSGNIQITVPAASSAARVPQLALEGVGL